jgi:MFS transporter, DHA1 family, inner membrane transport protein
VFDRFTRTEVRAALVAVLVARTAVNAGMRVVYPFLPAIARGLGISLAAAGALLALRSLVGLAAPLVARVVESTGRRTLMLVACGALTAGCLVIAGAPGVAVAAVGFALLGLAKPAFDVPMQAWFGDRVPYARRGRVLGTTELTWALSLLVTVPVSGVLIARFGWQAPFLLVAAMGIIGALAVGRLLASDRPAHRVPRPLRLTRARIAMVGVVLLYSVAAEVVFVVYGAWLEDDLALTVTAIGLFTIIVAAAELTGEGAVAAFADRVGLRRSVFAGLAATAVAYLSLGLVGGSLVAAVAVVLVWFIGFEVTIVASVPFVSELAVESRDRMLSLVVATIAGARAIGALVAPPVYAAGGIAAAGMLAAGLVVLAALLLLFVPVPKGTGLGAYRDVL